MTFLSVHYNVGGHCVSPFHSLKHSPPCEERRRTIQVISVPEIRLQTVGAARLGPGSRSGRWAPLTSFGRTPDRRHRLPVLPQSVEARPDTTIRAFLLPEIRLRGSLLASAFSYSFQSFFALVYMLIAER